MRERFNSITLAYWRLVPFTLSSTVTMVVLHEFHKLARTVWIDVCCTCFVVLADGEHRGNSSTRARLGRLEKWWQPEELDATMGNYLQLVATICKCEGESGGGQQNRETFC